MPKKFTFDDFVKKARLIHGDKYEYLTYINMNTKAKIICPIHGEFEQLPLNHLRGRGCPICGKAKKKKQLTTEEFIKKAKLIHGNKYDYSKAEFKNMSTPIEIICSKHGSFFQTPHKHLSGEGCPKCKSSRGENTVRQLLLENDIKFEEQKSFEGLEKLSFDFYLPKENILIEYNGVQHYEWIPFFQKTLHDFHKQKHHDWLKRKYCLKRGIKLFVIDYREEEKCLENLRSMISSKKLA